MNGHNCENKVVKKKKKSDFGSVFLTFRFMKNAGSVVDAVTWQQ